MRFIYTKGFIYFVACLVVACLLVVMQVKGWLAPVTDFIVQVPRPVIAVVRGVSRPVQGFFKTVYQLKKISNDNARLEQKVIETEQQLVMLDEYKRENEILKYELGFITANKKNYQPCTVIAHNPVGLLDSMLLNCGTDQGVGEGMVAVSQGHLVGKIVYANKTTSTVLLVTNSKFSADVRLSKTNAPGLIGGSFGTGLVLDRLSQNDPVEKGWLVVTAGISDKVPKDILVGEVADVISGPNDLFKKVTVISPIDYNNIDYVWVAKP